MRTYMFLFFGIVGFTACNDSFQQEATLADLVQQKKAPYARLAHKAAREVYQAFEGTTRDDGDDAELQGTCDQEFGELVDLFTVISEEQEAICNAHERLERATDSASRVQIEREVNERIERVEQLQSAFAYRVILLGSLFFDEMRRQAPEYPEVQALYDAFLDASGKEGVS